ncbi:MAG: hypothetical protein NVSMB38_04420 [Ktedonobacteraceae bacterium]
MQVVYERCCGLDVHKKVVVACLIVFAAKREQLHGHYTSLRIRISLLFVI